MGQAISHKEACELLKRELNIDKPYSVSETEQNENEKYLQRIVCLVHQDWLVSQINSKKDVLPQKNSVKTLSIEEQTTLLQPSHEWKYNGWLRINTLVIKKPLRKLVRHRTAGECNFENSSISDILQEISKKDQLNIKKMFLERFNKNSNDPNKSSEYLNQDLFREIIEETFGLKIKKIGQESQPIISTQQKHSLDNTEHTGSSSSIHLAQAILAAESDSYYYIFENTPQHTLYDVLAFSPAIVANSAAKFLFILYQILRCFSTFKSTGFSPSPSLTFSDFYVTNSMWLSVSAFDINVSELASEDKENLKPLIEQWLSDSPAILTPLFTCTNTLQDYVTMWVNCELTNFDYIMILNTLARRRMKDPSHYPIFPWVMDFTSPNGGWRDLSKSKFRLCKSDTQLDITFKNFPTRQSRRDILTHVPHHISDHPLTIISYYVYLARKTPKHVLCKNVRSRWVPDEYPSTMERLYEWTPEECIPEFYSDPSIFKSIHADLPDLQLPSWASSPEDFIAKHRSVLEGSHVSQNLNHWIDIMFGYKLFGTASIEAKNVYLSIVDGHNQVTNCGVLQLFSRPHPSRKIQSQTETTQSSLDNIDSRDNAKYNFTIGSTDEAFSDDISCVKGRLLEDDVKINRPVAIRRDIWSIDSAIDEAGQVAESTDPVANEPNLRPSLPAVLKHRLDSLLEGSGNEAKNLALEDININRDISLDSLDELENVERKLKFDLQLAPPHKEGIGAYEFGSTFDSKETKVGNDRSSLPLHPVTSCTSDMKLLASLVIELVLHDQSRLRTRRLELNERMKENIRLLTSNLYRFPSWLVVLLDSLLSTNELNEVTNQDDDIEMTKYMQTPSMLLNQLTNPFSLPSYFPALHDLLTALYSSENTRNTLSCSINRSTLSLSKIHDSVSPDNIIRASQLLPGLLEVLDNEGIDLLLTFLLPLFSKQDTKLTAFLNMFHALGSAMGPHKSLNAFYNELQKLYDHCSELNPEEWKLLDQSFISKVITVFGLSCFLDRFIPFVIDGLVDNTIEGSSSKEKSDNDSLEQNIENQETDNIEDKIENEFLRGQIEAESKEDYGANFSKDSNIRTANREKFESFLEDDEDGMSLFDSKPIDGRKIARSGVFTRLESIIEDDYNFKRGEFVEIIEEDEEIVIDADGQIGWKKTHDHEVNTDKVNVEGTKNPHDDQASISTEMNDKVMVSVSSELRNESASDEAAPVDNGDADAVFDEKCLSDKVKYLSTENTQNIENSLTCDKNEIETSNGNRSASISDPLSRFAVTDNSVSTDLSDSIRGEKNSADDECNEIEEDQSSYSIDSMGTDDNFKSFLIRRSAIRSKKAGDQSPFMIVSSDDEIGRNDMVDENSAEDINQLTIDKIPESNALEDIEKIPSSTSSKSFEQDLSHQDLSLSSLRWIVPWLGPAVTTRYVINAVLKKLPRIWLNLRNTELTNDSLIETLASKRKHLLDCIIDVVRVYGSSFVLHQFIPYAVHAVEVASNAPTVTAFTEGQLVTATEILLKTLSFLSADDLSSQIEILSREIFEPLLRLLSSLKKFSTGAQVRSILLQSLVDLLAALSKNLGQIDAREVMTPLLQRFFSCFDCIYRLDRKSGSNSVVFRKFSFIDDYDDADINGESSIHDDFERSCPSIFPASDESGESNSVHVADKNRNSFPTSAHHIAESEILRNQESEKTESDFKKRHEEANMYKDLYDSFKPSLAYYSYVLFCRVLGDHFIGSILYNEDLIWQLCSNYDEGLTLTSSQDVQGCDGAKAGENDQASSVGEGGEDTSRSSASKKPKRGRTVSEHEEEEPIFRSTWQHLDGEWLNHWKDSLECKNDDGKFVFHGRRLQTYAGHLSTVRDIYVPDNEHYFLSASRDKTVKLWLLKNHGNGTAQLGCSKTYDKHTKSVFAIQAIESKRLAVSCDGTVHFWDPIKSSLVSQVELNKNNSILSIRTLPVPHSTVAMATTEGTIKMYDVRQKSSSQEWKLVSSSAAGTVKCLCVNESGTWIAAGFSSGFISVLDLRTGILRGQWRAHESEVLRIEPYNEHNFLSSSADLRLKMWNEDGSLALRFRSPPEPIPCMSIFKDQCIWATATGNKIGITHTVENWASYSLKKLPQELFKGTVSNLTILPVNQKYLIGSEDGSVTLFV